MCYPLNFLITLHGLMYAADQHAELITAIFTGLLTISTIALWQSTQRLAQQAREDSIQTKRSLELAQQANKILETGQLESRRPWLSSEAQIGADIKIDKYGATVEVWFKAHNFGCTPAINVFWHPKIVYSKSGNNLDLISERESLLQSIKRAKNISVGRTVFPDEEVIQHMILFIRQKELDEIKDADAPFFAYLIGFVYYNSPLINDIMYTEFIYDIRTKHFKSFDLIDGEPAISEIKFYPSILHPTRMA